MRRFLTILGLAPLLPPPCSPSGCGPTPPSWPQMRWRSIGPANMSGRVSDVEAIP